MAKIDEYMKSFAKEIGLTTPFKQSYPGVYVFSLDESTVSVSDKNGAVALSASFGPIPGKKEALYTDLLSGDLFYQGTRGAAMGLLNDSNKIVVKKTIDRDLSDREFLEEMEDFLNTLETWKARAEGFR